MKKTCALLLSICLMLGMSTVLSAKAAPLEKRAAQAYNSSLKKTELNVSANNKLTTTDYNSIYIPIKDIFKNHVDAVKWDNKKKIAIVKNQGSELILNFSGKELKATENQVILPKSWTKLSNGSAGINVFVLAYLFEIYADDSDKERLKWAEKLSFLDIKQTEGIGGAKDGVMHIFVVYND
ncbi:hypothetical protein J2T13_002664 [Paenibacillus sp. DS2015]|uniref:hypothetical protein n=1 Tax=Paenibacillus sp. DS2015 TaxID=3373917 RepID=UPI003D1CD3D0